RRLHPGELPGEPDGRDLRSGEHVRGDIAQLERLHSVTEGVVHRDPALHRRHRGQWEHTGAVTGRVDSGPGGAGHTVDDDVSGVADAHTGLLQTEVLSVRNRTDGHEAVG